MAAVVISLALTAACAGEMSASDVPPPTSGEQPRDDHDHDHDHGGSFALAANEGGYLIVPTSTRVDAGRSEISFTIIGRTGEVQTSFEEAHEELMHLVAFPHDMVSYVHEHPTMSEDGVWTTSLPLYTEGRWRIVADFVPAGGPPTKLGYDLIVGEDVTSAPEIPAIDARVANNGPWQAVLRGETAHERAMPLSVSVTRDGRPALDSEVSAWMGEDAHLVGILAAPDPDDMLIGGLPARNAYMHMHPNGPMTDGMVTFTAPETPHGWWYLFLEMVLEGERLTFVFIVWAP